MANMTLKTSSGSTVITADSDDYTRRLYHEGHICRCISGRQVLDILGIHYDFELRWNNMSASEYEALRELYYSGETLYFDDGDVPPLVETETLASATATYDFLGISNPSSTHKAYANTSSSLPVLKGDFEGTEFSTIEYNGIAINNNAGKDEEITATDGQYYYHKFMFESAIAMADVRRFRAKVNCIGLDRSPISSKGCILYGWNGFAWVELGSHLEWVEAGPTDTIEYSTDDQEMAQQYVDVSDSYVRFLLRSRGKVETGGVGWTKVAENAAGAYFVNNLLNLSGTLYVVYDHGDLCAWDGTQTPGSLTSVITTFPVGEVLQGAAAVYNGKIYCGISATIIPKGKLYEWNAADDWVEKAPIYGSEEYIYALAVYDNGGGDALYAATGPNGKLLQWNDVDAWVEVAAQSGSETRVESLQVYDDGGGEDLYGGTSPNGKLLQWNDVDAWVEVAGQYSSEACVPTLAVFDDGAGDRLYGGTGGTGANTGLLLRLNAAGNAWELKASRSGNLIDISSLTVHDGDLYAVGTNGKTLTLKWDESSAWVEVCTVTFLRSMLSFDSELMGGYYRSLYRHDSDFEYSLTMEDVYAEVEINEDLTTLVIALAHTPILSSGDVVWVKNLTQATTLTLTTDYTISGKEVTVTGQTAGDEIEVKYNRYFEVEFTDIPEDWLSGDPGSSRERQAEIRLRTLVSGVQGS